MKQIGYIWQDILGPTSPDDDFFNAGGTSFDMLRILTRIQDTFGVAVDLEAAYLNPTITGLTLALRNASNRGPARTSGSLLHEVIGDAAAPLLVGVHGGFGDASVYFPLARRLRGFAVCAIEAVGLCDGRPPQARFEEMATEYVSQVLARYGYEREFLLSGYCTGGLVALEMARMMEDQGARVAGLILLNTSAPVPDAQVGDPAELMFWICRSIPRLDLATAKRAMSIIEATARAQNAYEVVATSLPVAFVQPAREFGGQPPLDAERFVESQWIGMKPFLQGPVTRRVLDLGPSRLVQEPWVESTAQEILSLVPDLMAKRR